MYAVYNTATGELVSIGSMVADPLPEGLGVIELTGDHLGLLNGTRRWVPGSLTTEPVPPDPRELNMTAVVQQAVAYLNGADAFQAQINADKANVPLTQFMGLAALPANATAANVLTRTQQQDLALKEIITILSRTLTRQSGLLDFAVDQIKLDGEFIADLRYLLDTPG